MGNTKIDLNAFLDSIGPSTEEEVPLEPLFSDDTTLTVSDLKNNSMYLQPIRDYMIERKGVDYKRKSNDEVVDDFVKSMRYFNANTVSTAGELRFVSKANQRQKDIARRAYNIYDQLGNVFVNDGLMGAVSGVGDYIFAAAKDPTNYLGLVTGGIGRFGAAGMQLTGKQVIKEAVRRAGREALQSGATKEAVKKAAIEAGREAAKRAAAQGMSSRAQAGVYKSVSKKIQKEGRRAMAKDAMRSAQRELFEDAGISSLEKLGLKGSLAQTTALDATAAVLQDVMAQQAELEVGSQESYSLLQTGFSSLLGGVAGGTQLAFRKFKGKSGLEDTTKEFDKLTADTINQYAPIIKKEEAPEAAKALTEAIDKWNAKVEKGTPGYKNLDDSSLIKEMIFGEPNDKGEIGGLAGFFRDKGYRIGKEIHVSDIITNVANSLTQDELKEINKLMGKYTSFQFGNLSGSRVKLGDLMAARLSEAGKTLNVASQLSKLMDSGLVAAAKKIADQVEGIDAREAKKAKESQPLRYGQSVWKRLLVSSPATTALNVSGFGMFSMGQTMADLFSSTALMTKGLAQLPIDKVAAQESFRRASALRMLQVQKIRNLLDPYTTYDAYMKFLDENKDAQKILLETMAGGVDRKAEKYGIDPSNPVYRVMEASANAANNITGVSVQDSFTKSQMFMGELDKYLRLEKKMTLKEALLSSEEVIDESVIQAALDTTLKSVYAKDYTTGEQPELLRGLAKIVESASNTPGLGTIIPFGRFMNNVVATAYQWSPLAFPELFLKPVYKKITRQEPTRDISVGEAWSRATIGSTAILLSSEYDKERREQGLGVYEVDVGGGTIVDFKNMFPFSTFLAAGRIFNMKRNGEDVPPELRQEILTQVAIGQISKDTQFGNDINNVLDILLNNDEGARGATLDGFAKAAGNFTAGFTRPIDAFNKLIGFATGTDTAKDVRQADSFSLFTQSATKYIDNVLEAFIDAADSVTAADLGIGGKRIGEELRVATREGDVYDPNPFARIFGLTIKQGRTAAEKSYSMAEMFPWAANERTKIPAYDKMLNSMLAPVLEQQTNKLLLTKEFNEGTLTQRRAMLKKVMRDAKSQIKERISKGYTGSKNAHLLMVNKANSKHNKEIRNETARAMKDIFGVTGSLEDYSFAELDLFMEYADYLKEAYDAAASF
jgi:hypothetical protein